MIIEKQNPKELKVNKKEIYRYLGYGKNLPSKEEEKHISEALNEAITLINPKAVYELCPVLIEEKAIDFGFKTVESRDLSKNLNGCTEAVVFCATLGVNFDRAINKYSKTSPLKAAIFQAVGTALIESWVNEIEEIFSDLYTDDSTSLQNRFSPGYGDLSLDFQKDIFAFLDCNRKIGVSLTDSLLMVPRKSVSAIVGIGEKCEKKAFSCKACSKKNCSYKRS